VLPKRSVRSSPSWAQPTPVDDFEDAVDYMEIPLEPANQPSSNETVTPRQRTPSTGKFPEHQPTPQISHGHAGLNRWSSEPSSSFDASPAQQPAGQRNSRGGKLAEEAFLQELAGVPGNGACADCGDPSRVTWASVTFGVVLCAECVGGHRALGTHISQPLSLRMDAWTPDMRSHMMSHGNDASNRKLEALPSHKEHKPAHDAPLEAKHAYVKAKYGDRAFAEGGSGIVHPSPLRGTTPAKSAPQQKHAGICIVRVLGGRGLPLGVEVFVEVCHSGREVRTAVKKATKQGAVLWNETLQLNVGMEGAQTPVRVLVGAMKSSLKVGKMGKKHREDVCQALIPLDLGMEGAKVGEEVFMTLQMEGVGKGGGGATPP